VLRLLFILFGFCFISATSKSGSGTAHLRCKSETGKTIFNADLQDITGFLEKGEFIVDGKKINFDGDDVYTIFDPKNGVFTIYINGETNEEFPNHKYVSFWAIPSSFKIISSGSTQIYEFKAKIFGTEPRKGKNLLTPQRLSVHNSANLINRRNCFL
jgi:hypothetical protein